MTADPIGTPPVATSLVDEVRPDARSVTSPAQFVAAMRELKTWSGLSYRQLESRAARCGTVLPRSTLMNALNRETLPREDLVAAFAQACGCGEAETARWLVARRRLALAGVREPAPPARRRTSRLGHGAVLLLLVVVAFLTATAVMAGLVAGQ